MPSSHKKVIVRRFTGSPLPGYLTPTQFLETSSKHTRVSPEEAALHLMDLAGRVVPVRLDDVKMVCYVRDFNLNDPKDPERLTRRSFLARPRGDGLWVRLTFRSGDSLEGLAATDLSLMDDLVIDQGVQLVPPDTRSNTQRIYVPRSSITELHVLGVITSRTRSVPINAQKESVTTQAQAELFRPPATPPSTPRQDP